jgi:uncharacterized protein (TIGR03435 family)
MLLSRAYGVKQFNAMLQNLLKERFKLAIHREKKAAGLRARGRQEWTEAEGVRARTAEGRRRQGHSSGATRAA